MDRVIHFHGTPVSPRAVLHELRGKCFCVSFAAPQDVTECHKIGQAVLLDNGAFSTWRQGKPTNWPGYYEWSDRWLDHPTTLAIVPDVIDGTSEDNDALIADWPHGERGMPVWHLHEAIERLLRLTDGWPKVAFGSSGQYAEIGTARWERRMDEAFNEIARRHRRIPYLHMLRGMSLSGKRWPFASVDSTDVARNHNRPHNNAKAMAERWDAQQCPARWEARPVQMELA